MPAQPTKYFHVTDTPGNVYTGAALWDGSDAGLVDGQRYTIQNRSEANLVYHEERTSSGPQGPGGVLRKLESGTYIANADSPLFAWTDQPGNGALLVISPAE